MEYSAVKIEHLTVAYHTDVILHDICLNFKGGQITAIIGPNGAGKSTLIKAMLKIEPSLTGEVQFKLTPDAQFQSYKEAQEEIAYIPQLSAVDWDFPTTVEDVVTMGRYGKLGWFKRPSRKDFEIASDKIDYVGLSDYKEQQIGQLSGGQRQRVFMARALAQEADIYVLDEPFAGVDMKSEQIIIKILKELTEQNKTVILVHHDLQTVAEYFDEVVLLNREVVANGPVEETLTDENIRLTYYGNRKPLDGES